MPSNQRVCNTYDTCVIKVAYFKLQEQDYNDGVVPVIQKLGNSNYMNLVCVAWLSDGRRYFHSEMPCLLYCIRLHLITISFKSK